MKPTHERVLLTGASAGIGRAVGEELARRGCRIAITARRADRLEAIAEELRKQGAAEVITLPADLSDPNAPAQLASAIRSRFGGLDVLINNAGYGLPKFFAGESVDTMRRQIEVNFTAPAMLTRELLPDLIASRGTVVNVGSAITVMANPVYGVYGATKAALAYWNDALRREVRHKGVKVCLVEPGPVDTEFFDAVKRMANDGAAMNVEPAPDSLYNALRDRPPKAFTADVHDAARRIVRLLDHPRRRISFLRRMIWPWRLMGGLFDLFPVLADLGMSGMMRRIEREQAAAEARGTTDDAR